VLSRFHTLLQTYNPFVKLLEGLGCWVTQAGGAFKGWRVTLSILNTESQWQQVLASWQDLQTGHIVSATEVFTDLALLDETAGFFHE
jgi:hypothetical protein